MPKETETAWQRKTGSGSWSEHLTQSIDRISSILDQLETSKKSSRGRIWVNRELHSHEATANLDHQPPATLFYLGLVKDIPQVVNVYVEELQRGRRKHWAVLSERDYDAMEEIYDIEETTLDRFPTSDIDFRVTVLTEGGPSVSPKATLIYDTT